MDNETKDLIKEYFTQNNHATAYPIYFTIRDVKWVACYNQYSGDRLVVLDSDHNLIGIAKSIEEMVGILREYADENGIVLPKDFHEDTYISLCDIEDLDFVDAICWETEEFVNKGVFLLESEAKEHLRLNNHHYSDEAFVYCEHMWRSPKTEKIFNFLKEMVDIKTD